MTRLFTSRQWLYGAVAAASVFVVLLWTRLTHEDNGSLYDVLYTLMACYGVLVAIALRNAWHNRASVGVREPPE